jgi:hypothetical protein
MWAKAECLRDIALRVKQRIQDYGSNEMWAKRMIEEGNIDAILNERANIFRLSFPTNCVITGKIIADTRLKSNNRMDRMAYRIEEVDKKKPKSVYISLDGMEAMTKICTEPCGFTTTNPKCCTNEST